MRKYSYHEPKMPVFAFMESFLLSMISLFTVGYSVNEPLYKAPLTELRWGLLEAETQVLIARFNHELLQ